MATTPPSAVPEWDSGDNNSTDPGPIKTAAGWAIGEVPASAHMNYLHKNKAEWINFLRDLTAPWLMLRNMEFTSTQLVSAFATGSLVYLPSFGRFYASFENGGNVSFFDSGDGLTWSSAFTTAEGANNIGATRPCEKPGDAVYFPGGASKIYRTINGLVANCTAVTPTFNQIDTGRFEQLIYDPVSDRFFAFGANSIGEHTVESATAVDGTWTVEHASSASGDVSAVAHDPTSGAVIYVPENSPTYWYATDPQGVWTESATFGTNIDYAYWNEATGKFWIQAGTNVAHADPATPGDYYTISGFTAPVLFSAEFGMVVWDNDVSANDVWNLSLYVGDATDFSPVAADNWAVTDQNSNAEQAMHIEFSPGVLTVDTAAPGKGIAIWPWGNADIKIAHARY